MRHAVEIFMNYLPPFSDSTMWICVASMLSCLVWLTLSILSSKSHLLPCPPPNTHTLLYLSCNVMVSHQHECVHFVLRLCWFNSILIGCSYSCEFLLVWYWKVLIMLRLAHILCLTSQIWRTAVTVELRAHVPSENCVPLRGARTYSKYCQCTTANLIKLTIDTLHCL